MASRDTAAGKRWLAPLLLAFGLAGALALPASAQAQGTPESGSGSAPSRGMNEAMQPYLALAIAGETADAVQTRMNAIFDGVSRESLSLQGQGLTTSERIGGDGDRQVTLWGRGFQHALEVEEGAYPFDGEVTGGIVGLDVPGLKPGLIVGLGVSHASSELKFTDTLSGAGLAGVHKTDLRGLHPYFGWQVSEEGNVWGTLGVAKGELEILVDNRLPHAEDFELKTLNFGGYNRFRERETPGGGDISLGLAGDSLYAEVRTEGPGALKASATRLRLGLEVGYDRGLDTGAELGSTLEMNLRHDDGDLLDGFGMELGGGMDFTLPKLGLRFDLKARTLLAHQDDVQEWGVSGSIAWDAGQGGRGFSLALKPHLGMTQSLGDDVWRQAAPSYGRQAGAAGPGHELEVRYGLPVLAGRETLTFFARSSAQEADQRLGLGAHFRLGEALSTGYEAVLQTGRPLSSAQESGHRAYIRYERDL